MAWSSESEDALPFNRASQDDVEYGFVSPFQSFPLDRLASLLEVVGTPDLFVDLGCGDGRVVIEVCKACQNTRGLGIELDDVLASKAAQFAKTHNVADRVSIEIHDIRRTPPEKLRGGVIFMYLIPEALRLLGPTVGYLLKSGVISKVVTFYWRLKSLEDDLSVVKHHNDESGIYAYTKHKNQMEGKANRVLTEAILMNVFNYFFYFTYQFIIQHLYPYPCTISAIQNVQFLAIYLAFSLPADRWKHGSQAASRLSRALPPPRPCWFLLRRLFLNSFIMALINILNGYTLKAASLGKFDLLKGTTVLFTAMMQCIFLREFSSVATWLSIAVVMLSFGLVNNTVNLAASLFGVITSLIQSFRSIIVVATMKEVNIPSGEFFFINSIWMSIFTLALSPVLDWWLFPCESLPYTLLFTDIRTWCSICLTTVFAFVWNLVFFDYSSLVSPLTYQFTNLVKQLVQTLLGIWSNPADANLEVYLSTLFKAIGGSLYIVSKSYEKAHKKKGALLSPLLPDVEVGTDICSISSTSSVSTKEQEISDLPSHMNSEIEAIARLESGIFPIEDASPQNLKLAPSEASTMTAEDRVPSNVSVCSLERSAEFQ